MAKIIEDKQEVVVSSRRSYYKFLIIAVGAGLVWWVSWSVLRRYMLDVPLTAGGVANIFTAVVGTVVLVKFRIARPLIVTLGSSSVLWPIGGALAGLWWAESLAWSVGLFMVSYGLFSLIAHIRQLWVSVLLAVVIALLLIVSLVQ